MSEFAGKSKFYDDDWMSKQERSFTRWINHVLCQPVDDAPLTAARDVCVCSHCCHSFHHGANTRAQARRVRSRASRFYQTEEFAAVFDKFDADVACSITSVYVVFFCLRWHFPLQRAV